MILMSRLSAALTWPPTALGVLGSQRLPGATAAAEFLRTVLQLSEDCPKGKSTLGFINPALYTIGLGSNYSTDFHDITSGSNGTYPTEKGYDLVTVWGSPKDTGLINTLAR